MTDLKTMVSKHRKIRLNNGGMSLVEVIIAITILGIVAVPVLHSLTTAMVYNSKARVRQDMTLKAESIMETFKGYDIETLQGMFRTNEGIRGIVAGADADANCDSYTAPDFDFSAGLPSAGQELVFSINGLKDGRDKTYDVKITATSMGKKNVLEMGNTAGTKDAIYKGDRNYDKNAIQTALADFRKDANKSAFVTYMASAPFEDDESGQALNADGDNISNADVDAEGFLNYIELYERKLKFDIAKDDSSGIYKVTAQLTYQYYIKDYPYYSPERTVPKDDNYYDEGETIPTIPEMEHFPSQLFYLPKYPVDGYLEVTIPATGGEEELQIYSNPQAAGLDRLMVYYYPQYDLGKGHDIIEINNNAGIQNLSCYVLKQRAEDISDTRTGVLEQGYSAKVVGHNSALNFKLYHNLGENIGEGNTLIATPTIEGFTIDASYTEASDLYQEEVLSYNLKLEVTDTANGNTVTSFESSKNEKIKGS